MNNQINSSNDGGNVGNGVRLFGTWIRPNIPPPSHQVVPNRTNTIRLFGVTISSDISMRRESSQQYLRLFGENIPINNSRSIRLFGQTIRVGNPSIVAGSQPLPSSSGIGHQVGNSVSNSGFVMEYNGIVSADQTNSALALPQVGTQGFNNANEEEFLEFNHENMTVDATFHAPGGIELDGTNINDELLAIDIIIRMLNGGLNPLEIEHALRIDSYKEMEGNLQKCTVCQEFFHDGEVVANLRCNHTFHRICITDWLEKNNSCPNCRATALDIDS